MNRYLNIKYAAIMRAFLLLMAVGLVGNVLAAKPDVATQAELDAAVAAQATVDTGQNTTISAQGALINALQSEIADLKEFIEKIKPSPKKIGDIYGGGVIFYLDSVGQHGLIVSLIEFNDSIAWWNRILKVTGATGDGVGAGISNTAIIVAAQSEDDPGRNFAAKLAADFSVQDDGFTPCTGSPDEICHGDWYLPSKHELNLLYHVRNIVGVDDAAYWSSTEEGLFDAWHQSFSSGQQGLFPKHLSLRVRPIRAF